MLFPLPVILSFPDHIPHSQTAHSRSHIDVCKVFKLVRYNARQMPNRRKCDLSIRAGDPCSQWWSSSSPHPKFVSGLLPRSRCTKNPSIGKGAKSNGLANAEHKPLTYQFNEKNKWPGLPVYGMSPRKPYKDIPDLEIDSTTSLPLPPSHPEPIHMAVTE